MLLTLFFTWRICSEYYFSHFPPHVIAKHVHTFLAAKKFAAVSGTKVATDQYMAKLTNTLTYYTQSYGDMTIIHTYYTHT